MRLALWGLCVVLWTAALLTPQPVQANHRVLEPQTGYSAAKFLHVGAYAFLTAAIPWTGLRGGRRWFLAAFLSLHAAGTEFLQQWVPQRTGSLTDVGLDHLGILLGLCTWPACAPPLRLTRRRGPARPCAFRLAGGRLELKPEPQEQPGREEDDTRIALESLGPGVVAQDLVEIAVDGVADHEQGHDLPFLPAERLVGQQDEQEQEHADRLVELGRIQSQGERPERGQAGRLGAAFVDNREFEVLLAVRPFAAQAEVVHQGFAAVDRPAVGADDDVAGTQAGVPGRRVGNDLADAAPSAGWSGRG